MYQNYFEDIWKNNEIIVQRENAKLNQIQKCWKEINCKNNHFTKQKMFKTEIAFFESKI